MKLVKISTYLNFKRTDVFPEANLPSNCTMLCRVRIEGIKFNTWVNFEYRSLALMKISNGLTSILGV
jgi:hypothetical protein